ncbi:unnamed protein product [Closterium sp. NIES-64]|nr:unnamed protein product [Closterium sp. NIES-64]
MHRKPVLLSPAKEWRDPIFAAPSPSRKDAGPLTTPRHREPPLSPFRSPLMGSANPAIPAGSPLGSRSRRALASPVRDVRLADRGEHGGGGGNSKRLAQLCILRTAQAQLNSAHPLRPPSSAQPSPIFSAESPSSLLCQAGSALSSSAQARASFESVQAPCSAPSGPMSAQEGAADMFDPFLLPAPAFPLHDQPSSPPPLPVAQPAQAPSAEDTDATSADRGDRCGTAEPLQHGDIDAPAAAMAAETTEKNGTMARDERNGENSEKQDGNGVGRIRMVGENGAQMGVMRAGKAAQAEPFGTRAGAECADRENVGRIDSRGTLGGKRGDNPGACSRDAQNPSVRSTLMELAANKKLPHGPRKGDPMYECKRCPLASPARSPLSHSAALTPPVHLPSRLHIPAALTGLTRGGNGGVGMGRLGLAAPGNLAADPEYRFLDSGKSVASVKLAVGWKKANGEKHTDWYTIQMWNDVATLAQNLKKGTRVYVKGRLHMEEYTDSRGATRLDTKVWLSCACASGCAGVLGGEGGWVGGWVRGGVHRCK